MFIRKIKNFTNSSFKEKKLFFEALFLLYFIKLKLLFVPFKYFKKNLNFKSKKIDLIVLNDLKRAIFRANQLTFWKNECLVLSLTSQKMLVKRKIDSTLHIGVLKENNKQIKAHAWLTYIDHSKNEIEFVKKEQNFVHLYSN